METEYSELLGWSQFPQFPPAMHQQHVLNKSHHLEEKQVLGGHKGGKESKQWLSQILEGLMIPCVLELVFYPGRNSSSTWLWFCARPAPPQRRWNSGLEEAAAGWVLLNITSVFTSHITKPLLLKEWDYRRISSVIKREKKPNKQKTQNFLLGMQGKSLDGSLSLIKAQKPKEMQRVYNIYCFK